MRYSTIAAATLSLGFFQAIQAHKHKEPPDPPPRRLNNLPVVTPEDDIVEFLKVQRAAGVVRSHFVLAGLRVEEDDEAAAAADVGGRSLTEAVYEIPVVTAQSSMTGDTLITTTTTHTGPEDETFTMTVTSNYSVSQILLVSDYVDATGDFALLVVDTNTSSVEGMAMKSGEGEKLVKVQQESAGATTVVRQVADYFLPADWSCGTEDDSDASDGRSLRDQGDHLHHHSLERHVHDSHVRERHVHNHHEHEHEHGEHDFLAKLKSDLGDNGDVKILGKRRELYPTDNFPNLYSYQVDFYIEIDQALVNHHSSEVNAFNYVNALVTAASSIYEKEIDTHLHVAHIAVTDHYDDNDILNTEAGLDKMKETYGNSTWHHTGIDLHHALLYKNLRGGRATLGGICDSEQGYGITTNVRGTITNIGPMYGDIYVFLHEVGHNFGAQHTHQESRVPLIDTCGIKDTTGANSECPDGANAHGAGTIMSYCHECGGGPAAIGLTFGGIWNENDRTNITNWQNDQTIGAFNVDAKRVPQGMWEYVSSRTCTSPNLEAGVPQVICTTDAECVDGNSCTDDTCDSNTGTCENAMRTFCCGNFECESGEYESCSDCGAFPLGIAKPSGFSLAGGIMFNIEAKLDVVLEGLTFYPQDISGTVTVHYVSGGYAGNENDSNAWTLAISSQSFTATESFAETSLTFDASIQLSAENVLAFYVEPTGNLAFGTLTANPVASDDNLKILNPAKPRTSSGGGYSGGPYSWVGHVSYKIPETGPNQPTQSPTLHPTRVPTTGPTTSPISGPSDPPTTSPSKSPTIPTPSSSPTKLPTSSPTSSPTSVPTSNPSKAPSSSPGPPVDQCGNEVCELGEFDNCADCGSFILFVDTYSCSRSTSGGMMFNVEPKKDIVLQVLSFIPLSDATYNVNLYTAPGGWNGKERERSMWRKLQLINGPSYTATASTNAAINVLIPSVYLRAGVTQAFYLHTDNNWKRGCGNTADPVGSDDNLNILNPTRSPSSGEFGFAWEDIGLDSAQWTGALSYKLVESGPGTPTHSPTTTPPSTSPTTSAPTTPPTTSPPTMSPTVSPTTNPSMSPSASPTNTPTTPPPTVTPTTSPTSNPSKSPSATPTNAPTTPIPSKSPTELPTSSPSKTPSANPSKSPTTSPTSNPSRSPSATPTNAPTTPIPSKNPTEVPTSSPSKTPSANPTNAPTTSPPTANPTSSPTHNPSKSPSVSPTDTPTTPPPTTTTMSPTTRPTEKPTTRPTIDVVPRCKCRCRGRCKLGGCAARAAANREIMLALLANLQKDIASLVCPASTRCTVQTTTIINGQKATQSNTFGRLRRLSSQSKDEDIEDPLQKLIRQLQDANDEDLVDLTVEYDVTIDADCSTPDCSDAQAIANSFNEEVTNELNTVVDDGTLLIGLQQSSELSDLLEVATTAIEFSEVDVSIISILTDTSNVDDWYPDWVGKSHTCLSDGNAPYYMKLFGRYYEPSMYACCERYFSWDLSTCAGASGRVPSGFYPNFGASETKCFNSVETPNKLPDYMRGNSEYWLENDIGSCCKRHYNWVYADCMNLSGGSSSFSGTNEWYANQHEKICQQDCPKESGGTCGGLAMPWDTLHQTAATCCKEKLSWIASSLCEAQSSLTAVIGTYQWYVDWGLDKCVKDCNDFSDTNCGGIAKSWDELYGTSTGCCKKIWYVEREECTVG